MLPHCLGNVGLGDPWQDVKTHPKSGIRHETLPGRPPESPQILVSPTPSSLPAHRWMPRQRSNVSEVVRCLRGNHDGCHGTTVYLPRFTIEINPMTGKIQVLWDDFFSFSHTCMVYFPLHGWLVFCGFSSRYILYRIHVWSISTIFYGQLVLGRKFGHNRYTIQMMLWVPVP